LTLRLQGHISIFWQWLSGDIFLLKNISDLLTHMPQRDRLLAVQQASCMQAIPCMLTIIRFPYRFLQNSLRIHCFFICYTNWVAMLSINP
jgi:hypothetical protein